MKRIELTSEWLGNWSPKQTTEVTDRGCKGLLVRGGPSGIRTFYRWTDVRDEAGAVRRRRVKLGHWPTFTLADARKAVHDAREDREAEVTGTVDVSISDIAKAYRQDVLSNREHADEAWNIVRVHIVEARPDPKRPPFGEWSARSVRPPDIAAVVRYSKQPRTVHGKTRAGRETTRQVGGPGVARVVLRELKAIFATAIGAGSLEMSPAAAMRAQALGLHATSRERWLNEDEIKAFFAALDLTALLDGTAKEQRLTPAVRLGLAFLLYTPVRTHSFIGARWDEFDLEAKRWTIPVARLKLKKHDRATARPFVVPLSDTSVAILKRLQALANGSPWVLASPVDPRRSASPKALIRALARLREAGAKGEARLALASEVTVHDLRRTWRAWADELGVAFEVAERSLGHALPGVADVYARGEMVERRADAAQLVAAAFDRARLGEAAKVVPIKAVSR